MAMVGVDSGTLQADQPKSSGLVLGRRPLGTVLHSSNEPGELAQWLCHHEITINIIIIIIFFYGHQYYYYYYLRNSLNLASRNCFDAIAALDFACDLTWRVTNVFVLYCIVLYCYGSTVVGRLLQIAPVISW